MAGTKFSPSKKSKTPTDTVLRRKKPTKAAKVEKAKVLLLSGSLYPIYRPVKAEIAGDKKKAEIATITTIAVASSWKVFVNPPIAEIYLRPRNVENPIARPVMRNTPNDFVRSLKIGSIYSINCFNKFLSVFTLKLVSILL